MRGRLGRETQQGGPHVGWTETRHRPSRAWFTSPNPSTAPSPICRSHNPVHRSASTGRGYYNVRESAHVERPGGTLAGSTESISTTSVGVATRLAIQIAHRSVLSREGRCSHVPVAFCPLFDRVRVVARATHRRSASTGAVSDALANDGEPPPAPDASCRTMSRALIEDDS